MKRLFAISVILSSPLAAPSCLLAIPAIHTPDSEISEVFEGNWDHTLRPCEIQSGDPDARPWKVDVDNRFPGWYPAIDQKYCTRAFLFCEGNLSLALNGWQYTTRHMRLENGGIIFADLGGGVKFDPVGTVIADKALDGTTIGYPLRASATIDYILIGDMIFCFSQDREWLRENIPYMRNAARWIEGWIDDEGLLDTEDYDHDMVMRRGTDGTGQASAYLAFRKLGAMEDALGNEGGRNHCEEVARRLADGAKSVLWDSKLGFFVEYAEVNNIARSGSMGSIGGASSVLNPEFGAEKAIDGVIGYGPDLLKLHAGAGQREWSAKGETVGAWLQVNLKKPTAINRVILYNRQDASLTPAEAFSTGRLEFSDGSTVPVHFGPGMNSRAVVPFASRTVTWVKFTGERMQGEGHGNAGLAEFEITPTAQPYLKHSHGMSDANFALVGYGLADDAQSRKVWRYFKEHEKEFYFFNGVPCPTWTVEFPDTYTPDELGSFFPNKDRTAMARMWRHDCHMRKRMGDGEGIYQTIGYANALYRRSAGGGLGFFGERYDMGRFKPGDLAQGSVPKYAEYPAEYNATVVGEVLFGISADEYATISIDPCVPTKWYKSGFGIDDPRILKDRRIGFTYRPEQLAGWITGKPGRQVIRVLRPPGVESVRVLQDGNEISHAESGRYAVFELVLTDTKRHTFLVKSTVQG
jgi:hypothetical protein